MIIVLDEGMGTLEKRPGASVAGARHIRGIAGGAGVGGGMEIGVESGAARHSTTGR